MNQTNTTSFLVITLLVIMVFKNFDHTNAQTSPLVSAIVLFGDSIIDVGNNNLLPTLFKADYLPYGRDFNDDRSPTGRFCNGKLAVDIIVDKLGFNNSYPPAYLRPDLSNNQLVNGVNFASAASGYDNQTAIINHAISLPQQLEYYKEYQRRLASVVSMNSARTIRDNTLFIIGAGTSDFVLNYYINPLVNIMHTPSQYSTYLVDIFSRFIKDLYRLGARRIGVTSLPPMGCLPLVITLFGLGKPECVEQKNMDSREFNVKMNETITRLKSRLPGLKMEFFDIYTPLHDLVQNPSKNGFVEGRRGCCGTGRIETTSILCNPKSIGTCVNASQFVFWDSVHPSETTNRYIANTLVNQGISLITN
ncbi:hypothetical protein V2J09_005637 [Rumex salicifolius]